MVAPAAVARGWPRAHARAGAQEAAAARAASLRPVSVATGSRGEGPGALAAAAAISAASCSSRPRRHGNAVTHRGRFPARLARVTPVARAPSSLTCCAPALPPAFSPLRHGAPSRAPLFPLLPAPPRPAGARGRGAREGGRWMGDAY